MTIQHIKNMTELLYISFPILFLIELMKYVSPIKKIPLF